MKGLMNYTSGKTYPSRTTDPCMTSLLPLFSWRPHHRVGHPRSVLAHQTSWILRSHWRSYCNLSSYRIHLFVERQSEYCRQDTWSYLGRDPPIHCMSLDLDPSTCFLERSGDTRCQRLPKRVRDRLWCTLEPIPRCQCSAATAHPLEDTPPSTPWRNLSLLIVLQLLLQVRAQQEAGAGSACWGSGSRSSNVKRQSKSLVSKQNKIFASSFFFFIILIFANEIPSASTKSCFDPPLMWENLIICGMVYMKSWIFNC